MERWRGYLDAGLTRMKTAGLLHDGTDTQTLALSIFAALHGGLALSAMMESIEPLQAALDGALVTLHASAAAGRSDRASTARGKARSAESSG
jgi:hypothetical protein